MLVGQTTASEFGGVNVTRTVLHGTTHNPWQLDRTPGGSSGGSAAAVAGGIVTLATGGDGGGSIRIPAGFCGLVGLKGTFGRIPLSPMATYGNLTGRRRLPRRGRSATRPAGSTSCNGHDAARSAQPAAGRRLGGRPRHASSTSCRGLRVAVVADWGGADRLAGRCGSCSRRPPTS